MIPVRGFPGNGIIALIPCSLDKESYVSYDSGEGCVIHLRYGDQVTPFAHKGGERLSQVNLSEGESFESLLKRFTKRVQQDGILSEIRRRDHFESPSVRRKRKAAAKRRKSTRA